MPTAPILINRGTGSAADKHRPLTTVVLDAHALGIRQIEDAPIPRYIPLPREVEPGDCFEIVLANRFPVLLPLDRANPSLLPGLQLMVHDTVGDQGQIAEASLLNG